MGHIYPQKILCLQHVAFEGPALIYRQWQKHWAMDRQDSTNLQSAGHFEIIHLYQKTKAELNSIIVQAGHEATKFDLLLVMGGPHSVYDHPEMQPAELALVEAFIQADKKILGICLGAQLLAHALKARVYPGRHQEIGWFELQWADKSAAQALPPVGLETVTTEVRAPLKLPSHVYQWHGDTFDLPQDADWLFCSELCQHQAFIWQNQILGLQFHLEMDQGSIKTLFEECGQNLEHSNQVQTLEQMLLGQAKWGVENYQFLEQLMIAFYSLPISKK